MLPGKNNFNKIKRSGASGRKFFYLKNTYKNPFFQRRKISGRGKSRGLAPKHKLIVTAGAATVIVVVWLLFFSNLFKIKDIAVSGVSDNLANEVKSIAGALAANKFLGGNNLLLFSKSRLAEALNEKYYLQELAVTKSLPHTLKIYLREKQPAAVWLEDDKYFQLDGQGNVIKEVDPLNISRQSLPLIENLTGFKIQKNKAVVSQIIIAYIVSLFNEFQDQKHGFEIEKFIVDRDGKTVRLAVLGGPQIYFNAGDGVTSQAARLDLIIKEKLKDNFKNKQYIDLRFSNNIYIK